MSLERTLIFLLIGKAVSPADPDPPGGGGGGGCLRRASDRSGLSTSAKTCGALRSKPARILAQCEHGWDDPRSSVSP